MTTADDAAEAVHRGRMSTPFVDPALESAVAELTQEQCERIRTAFTALATAKDAERVSALAELSKAKDAERVQAVRDAVNEAIRERDRQHDAHLAVVLGEREQVHAMVIAECEAAYYTMCGAKDDTIEGHEQRIEQLEQHNAALAVHVREYESLKQLVGFGAKAALAGVAFNAFTKRMR